MPRAALTALAGGSLTAQAMADAGIELTGDASALQRLTAVLDPGDDDLDIVTP